MVDYLPRRPSPYPDRLVERSQLDPHMGPAASEALSYPDFFDWRTQQHSFSAIASYRGIGATLTGAGEPQRLDGQVVSSELFRLLGVPPLVGPAFAPADEHPAPPPGMRS